MMGTRETLKGGDEWDAFSRKARKFLRFKPGIRAAIKRRFWKRVRAYARKDRDGLA